MATGVRSVEIARGVPIDDYRDVDGAAADVDACERLGARLARALGTRRVFMLSSTARGGGVAEMMPRLCALLRDVGVDARWLVLQTDEPGFFETTKRLHNLLHGRADEGALDERVYDRVSRDAADALHGCVERGDVLVVHDPQPLGAGALLAPLLDGALVWRCHVGVPFADAATDAAWTFLAPRLAPYPRALFSSERYVPPALAGRAGIVHPSIDPRDHKNRDLRPAKLVGVLASAGLLDAPLRPPWARFAARATRLVDGGFVAAPIAGLLFAPLVVQVSRFDRLKGFPALLAAFARLADEAPSWARAGRVRTERALDEIARAELILAGPDPGGVADDPEAGDVVDELRRAGAALPAPLPARVHGG
jgi:trehalose synthase